MRKLLIALCALLLPVAPASAQLSIHIGLPSVNIGFEVPAYPNLVPVPGYPVYYAPGMDANYFFYDGMYWSFQGDSWYASTWYNGPWSQVAPEAVPLYVLRVPVQYYRRPPAFFVGWAPGAPPRWDVHWGPGWAAQHNGWNHWNHASMPHPAPLPTYQRNYSGGKYPSVQQQQALRTQNYHYQPRDAVVKEHYQAQAQAAHAAPPGAPQGHPPEAHQQEARPAAPHEQAAPRPGERPPQERSAPRPQEHAAPREEKHEEEHK